MHRLALNSQSFFTYFLPLWVVGFFDCYTVLFCGVLSLKRMGGSMVNLISVLAVYFVIAILIFLFLFSDFSNRDE